VSKLKTYDRPSGPHGEWMPWPFYIIDDTGQIQTRDEKGDGILGPDHAIAPGCWVSMQTGGGFGFVVAINDDNLTVLWSDEPKVLGGFSNFAMPLIRRVFPPQLAQQLIQVQPMTAPVGNVFYMDYKYGDMTPIQCITDPWWRKMWSCTSGKIRSWLRSFSSWVRSWRASFTTNASTPVPSGPPARDRHREVLTTLFKDPDQARKLVEKWDTVLTRHGGTGEPSEGPEKD
jgi:hypothetical protein